jgi:hypothetical protein
MSADGGRPVRGFRPSHYGLEEEPCEEAELVRLANIETYTKRASAGLPIFEDSAELAASLLLPKRAR